jgi:chromosome segregation protein
MPYIKKLVMHGFKSFPKKTEIPFEKTMNIIVGPNGSGKSNIADALCFVLGRLSIKSIRAAKAANLIFSGNKTYKPGNEASVELVFDNSDKSFPINENELRIKRIVRKNGQSLYKIGNETKKRQELIELLAQAEIDPHGFNIVLQGEIASLIKTNPEERRKIIEEVAGISIYETRKQKSLRELEKTGEKLKEVSAILKEKTNYLRNLDKERQEALNYKKLEKRIKQCKATIINKKINQKQTSLQKLNKTIQEQEREIQKIKNEISERNSEIEKIQEKTTEINNSIQKSTSSEQEKVHSEIAELKAEAAGANVRKENFEIRIEQGKEKQENLKEKIKTTEKEIQEVKTSSPKTKNLAQEQEKLQDDLALLEKQRKRFYTLKSRISFLEDQKSEKQKSIIELKKELEIIEKNINSLFSEIKYTKSAENLESIKEQTSEELKKLKSKINNLEKQEIQNQRKIAILEEQIEEQNKLKKQIPKMDICPLCRNKITKEHISYVLKNANEKIESAEKQADELKKKNLAEKIQELKQDLEKKEIKLNEIEIDSIKLKNAEQRKQDIKKIKQNQAQIEKEISQIKPELERIKSQYEKLKNIEEQYDEASLKLQEISFSNIDADTETNLKQRELNKLNIELKSVIRDVEESEEELEDINQEISEKVKFIEEKELQEKEIYERFDKLFAQKNELQDEQKTIETDIIGFQHTIKAHEERISSVKIEKAQINAQIDALKDEFKEFENTELLSFSIDKLEEKLKKAEFRISQIRNVNLKALEIYEKVKEQCSLIEEKTKTIENEKLEILKIIQEIDKKKKKSFIKTLNSINEYFTRNFSQLSRKGSVFLELENKDEPFEAGLNILLKVARGKYFDVSSLSGGEKTLVALSLIFAIQEYNPYCFYIFDEIDAALDKHNSERLAALLKKYITSGQYIIITHNDALISEATTLYGVSMQENISKIVSINI